MQRSKYVQSLVFTLVQFGPSAFFGQIRINANNFTSEGQLEWNQTVRHIHNMENWTAGALRFSAKFSFRTCNEAFLYSFCFAVSRHVTNLDSKEYGDMTPTACHT